MGRLSNPPEPLQTVVTQGSQSPRQTRKERSAAVREVTAAAEPAAAEDTERLSNPARRPVQRRLRSSEVDTLVARYEAGQSLRGLAAELGIHHRTVPRTSSSERYRGG